MHCGGCVNRVARALRTLDEGVAVTLEPPRARFSEAADVSIDVVNAVLSKLGEYRANDVA
jgi:copper chaperone CopZ